jgi:hypothetical protein
MPPPFIIPIDSLSDPKPTFQLTLVKVVQQMRGNISTLISLVMKTKMKQHLAHYKQPQIQPGLIYMPWVVEASSPTSLFQG